LGVTKQDRRTHYEQKRRQQNGSKRVNVLERIEADPAEAPRRIVAAQPRDVSVRRFMERNGNNQGDDPGRGRIERAGNLFKHGMARPSDISRYLRQAEFLCKNSKLAGGASGIRTRGPVEESWAFENSIEFRASTVQLGSRENFPPRCCLPGVHLSQRSGDAAPLLAFSHRIMLRQSALEKHDVAISLFDAGTRN